MKCNIGKTDRTIRLIVGVVILVLGLVAQSWWGIIGLVLAGPSVIRWCPIYATLGCSTSRESESASQLHHT